MTPLPHGAAWKASTARGRPLTVGAEVQAARPGPGATYKEILYEVDGPVATITFNRPQSMNAWTAGMGDELRAAVTRAEEDPAVVGVVLTGAGRSFCAGADMKVLTTLREDAIAGARGDGVDGAAPTHPDLAGEYTYLLGTRKPIIAAINGPIVGMAIPLALCCDIRFMAEDAPLITAFAQRGLIGELGVTWLLSRVVGLGVALDLLLSSRRVSGEEAARLGLVNRAMPAEKVVSEARSYVEALAATCAPRSMAIIKRQVHEQASAGLGRAERESRVLREASFKEPDFAEGVRAFLEKRRPQFTRVGLGMPDPLDSWPA